MNVKPIPILVGLAAISFIGLLSIQAYWFRKAFRLEEKQFDEKVDLALRSVADDLLAANGDRTTRILPITRTASNSFAATLPIPIRYSQLATLLKDRFAYHGIQQDYQLAVYEPFGQAILLGGLIKTDSFDKYPVPCLTRQGIPASYCFSVTFPSKNLYLAEGMRIWQATAFTLVFLLFFIAYSVLVIRKEKKLSALKRDFINNMTHELKTPLTNISIASEVLRKSSARMDTGKTTRYAELIYQEVQRLERQVDHVLGVARLEREDLPLKRTLIDVHQLIEEVMSTMEVRVRKRNGFIGSTLEAFHSIILADEHHLKNVLFNLLDNADKYSPQAPHIRILTRNDQDRLIIAVQDQGIGMSQAGQALIFDTFYQVPSGDVHEVSGFGLGLSYVKTVVEAHHGSVRVKSEPRLGSIFEVSFQCA